MKKVVQGVDLIPRSVFTSEADLPAHWNSGKTINNIIEEECRKQKVNIVEVQGGDKRRKASAFPSAIAYRSMEELGLTALRDCRHLGVNTTSITRAIERAEKNKGS